MDESLTTGDSPRASVERKILLRLVVPIALITFVNSIDRVNVSYSGAAMSADLGLSPAQFGQGVSMFFLAYLIFQYPHAWLLRRWGIKRWIFASMLVWGPRACGCRASTPRASSTPPGSYSASPKQASRPA